MAQPWNAQPHQPGTVSYPERNWVAAHSAYFPGYCAACRIVTADLCSRTMEGKKYCIPCLKKGAGLEEYAREGLQRAYPEEKQKGSVLSP